MIGSLFKVLGAGLSLWESKEKRKYLDRFMKLEREYYEEYNKDIADDAVLDNLRFELELLSTAFSAEVGKANTKDMQK